MGVQQLIANNTNVLIDSVVVASSVTPSTEITRTAINRAGTGLVELSGLYTGHVSADYDVEIIAGEGNGRASAPVFSGVGSGSITVAAADLPAQDVTITLLTPPYPGATAEARIGADIVRAAGAGALGNLISITVDRSGLSFAESGSSTLESVAEGVEELTGYKWDIPGVVCSTDLKGNVPADAPRVRLGSDPTIYRIIKDSRSGTMKTILSPAAVRAVPAGVKIWIVTGTYTVAVNDGTDTEIYTNLITGYDLLSALLTSAIVQPAYIPVPVATAGGNASVDLPLVTGSTALLTDSSSAGVRPDAIVARATAVADTIRIQSRGNGAWSVSSAAGTVYPDAFEGQQYAPAASPVMLTIPARPQPDTATSTQPVFLADKTFATREADTVLPLLCIEGLLGVNASPKTITATYAKRPIAADCPCPTGSAYFSKTCLGLINTVTEEGDMSLDPAYQTRLMALYEWQKSFVGANAAISGSELYDRYQVWYNTQVTVGIDSDWVSASGVAFPFIITDTAESALNPLFSNSALGHIYPTPLVIDYDLMTSIHDQILAAHPLVEYDGVAALVVNIKVTGGSGYLLDAADLKLCQSVVSVAASTLELVYASTAGAAAWDTWFTEIQSSLSVLLSTGKLSVDVAPSELLARYQAGADYVLAIAGIVPGKSDTPTGSTGCWEDNEAEYWWLLSDGYAPAFTGVEYYSTRAGTFENSQEFGFMIKCGCPDTLLEGDQLTIQIGANLAALVWSSNEFLEITTIPTTPLFLAGGKDPDNSETWSVAAKDSSNATLPAAAFDETNRSYSSSGLEFTIAPGGIPFNVGDRFSFTVEGGTFKWRKDAGVWSAATNIADNTLLDSGLYVSFLAGAAPSFFAGDSYSFRADQTSAATGLLKPDNGMWSWPAATGTITLTMPEARSVSHLAVLHSLSADTALAVDYWDTPTGAFKPLVWASGVVRDYLHVVTGASITTTAIRITADNPGAIRWLWAGVPFQPLHSAAVRIRNMFDLSRAKQAGSASVMGRGQGATIDWSVMEPADADKLLDMVTYIKTNGDLPVVFIPQLLHPEEAICCRLADDGLELTDIFEFQPDDTNKRVLSASMELTPEWR